jgi:TM2 domain-containing membrane protein YozV
MNQKKLNTRRNVMSIQNQPPKFYKNPTTATILSFFIAGLGQIYNGEIGRGIIFMILYFISFALMFAVVGFITTPILWIWGMIDANKSAKKALAALRQSYVVPTSVHRTTSRVVPKFVLTMARRLRLGVSGHIAPNATKEVSYVLLKMRDTDSRQFDSLFELRRINGGTQPNRVGR